MPETFRSTGSHIVLRSFHPLTDFESSSPFTNICNVTTFAGIFSSTLGHAVSPTIGSLMTTIFYHEKIEGND